VPAARTSSDELGVVRRENPEVLPVERFIAEAGPCVLLQGASHPLSYTAEHLMDEAGTIVLPDFTVNLGGLGGCWVESAWREELRGSSELSRVRLGAVSEDWFSGAVRANVRALLAWEGHPREAARRLVRDASARLARYAGSLVTSFYAHALVRALFTAGLAA